MNTFAVLARTGKRVHADECDGKEAVTKYAKGYFRCIDCSEEVFVRRGHERTWHFCHYCKKAESRCPRANGGETREHYEAKHFVANNIARCAFAVEKCPMCLKKKFFVGSRGSVLVHRCRAEVERRIDGTSRVADVGIINPATQRMVAAVEIFHTHEVDDAKHADCAAQGVAVLEVSTEEVQRWKEYAVNKDKLMQLETMHMMNVHCTECAMKSAFTRERNECIAYESWLEGAWTWYWDVQMQMRKRAATALKTILYGQHELARTASNEYWYSRLWESYGEMLAAEHRDAKWQRGNRRIRSVAMDAAHARIQELEALKRREQKGARRSRGKCIGKCRQCRNWMFEDDETVEVVSSTMPKAEWDALFEDDPPKYMKRYTDRYGEHNCVTVHEECSMKCPQCGDDAFLHKLARYGMCFSCNSACKSPSFSNVHYLEKRWAARGDFDLLDTSACIKRGGK